MIPMQAFQKEGLLARWEEANKLPNSQATRDLKLAVRKDLRTATQEVRDKFLTGLGPDNPDEPKYISDV